MIGVISMKLKNVIFSDHIQSQGAVISIMNSLNYSRKDYPTDKIRYQDKNNLFDDSNLINDSWLILVKSFIKNSV